LGAVDVAATDLDGLDLTDLDCFAGGFPDDDFARLRALAPVWWHRPTAHTPDGVGFWVVSRHEDVLAVVADPDAFSSAGAPGATGGGTLIQDLPFGFAAGVLLNMSDDPHHQRVRRLVTPSVAPRALAAMEEDLSARTAAILDDVPFGAPVDFLLRVAVELPLQATAILLGVPEADRHDLMAWSNATLDYQGRELGEYSDAAQEAAAATAAYGAALVEAKRHTPGDDMLSALVRARVEGDDGRVEPLGDLELQMFFSLLIAAGSETTRNAIALGVAALVEHPDQWARLQRHRALVPAAVEEILRWSSPTLYNRRTATRDTEIAGVPVRAGDKVTLWWASANRDERVFDDPGRFDVGRSPNPHVAFGYRTHFCLGANLARLEIRLVLEALLARCSSIELAGPIERFRTNKHAGVRHMPVVLHARSM
jgi:cytochrome P450